MSINELFAQLPGINLEAIARDRNNNPAKDRRIYVHIEIIPANSSNSSVFSEEHQTRTNEAGIFQISIGKGTRVGGNVSSIYDIPWRTLNYLVKIKVSIEPVVNVLNWNYQQDWVDLGVTPFGIVPYAGTALSADNVSPNAAVISFSGGTTGLTPTGPSNGAVTLGGVLNIANGGTGSSVKNFVDLTTAQTIDGQKNFTQLLMASAGLVVNNSVSLQGTATTLKLNGNTGAIGDVLLSQGPNLTPTWVNLQQAVGIKSKSRSVLLTSIEEFDIPVLNLDNNDGISVVLEVGSVPIPIPNHYIYRDILNNKVTVHFTAPYTGYVTWLIVE